ncbi:MAG: putative holin [Desulfotalea sp.]
MSLPKRFKKIVCLSLYLIMFLLVLSPVEAQVIFYKIVLTCLGATLGWWLDFFLFPYSRPSGYLMDAWQDNKKIFKQGVADYPVCPGYENLFAFALVRRAGLVVGLALGLALAL